MSDVHTDPAQDYLRRLRSLLTGVTPAERDELLANIEEHLAASVERGDLAESLVRLGPPEEVARAARAESASPLAEPGTWAPRISALVAAAAIAGFTLLGALLCVVAGFDENSDWSFSPVLILLVLGSGLIAGIVASVLSAASSAWRTRDAVALTGLWLGTLAVVIGAWAAASAIPVPPAAVRLVLAGGVLLTGALAVAGALSLAAAAVRRVRAPSRG